MKNIKEIIQGLNTHDWTPEPGKTSIILIDLQEYFRGIIDPILGNLIKIIDTARQVQIPLFFTQHGHEAGADTGMLGQWWADLIMKGSEEARLLPELGARPEDVVIQKNTYSAFHGTELEKKLREVNTRDLVVCGVMTNLCCETTARDAFVRDYRVFFLADGTSTVSEDYHFSTLKNLSSGFAVLLTCEQLADIVKGWTAATRT